MMHKLLIGGRWLPASDEDTIPVLSPVDGQVYAHIARGRAAEIDAAVRAAQQALDGEWGRMTATERGRVLMKLANLVQDHAQELAAIEARDTGKALATAMIDMEVLARYFEFYGAGADKVHGQVIPFLNGYTVTVLREPLGVTGHIIPWNYPAQMFGRTCAPALAMGNACVVKPAEDACLSILRIAELALEAGLPPGALNIVTGYGEEAGAALSAHPGLGLVSFTGSSEVGTLVQQATARNAVKCVLELGGKSAQIVFDDADLDKALQLVVRGIVQNTGQTCTAGSRLLVQRDIYDRFVERVAERFGQLRAGAPDTQPDCGPVINRKQMERVDRFVEEAVAAGIPLLGAGRIDPEAPSGGFYVRPALFAPVPRDHRLAKEEVFGPVLAAMPFDDEADAIALANDTDYGLQAAVWTENGGRQQRVAKAMRVGQVYINCYGAGGGVELPFGGVKRSGHGREKGFLALEEMSTTKTVVHLHG
jgi:aldehyde dehydrogenase (NAD+)